MSVHGEYGRALDALLISVQRLSSLDSKVWAQGLVEARSSQHAELSMAAAACSFSDPPPLAHGGVLQAQHLLRRDPRAAHREHAGAQHHHAAGIVFSLLASDADSIYPGWRRALGVN
ncbi:MAG TPA: hypothetical protein EYQ46_23605, partial [Myxococcales bacterium]|nr:hypothetical protein [Myxococcales bacterium]